MFNSGKTSSSFIIWISFLESWTSGFDMKFWANFINASFFFTCILFFELELGVASSLNFSSFLK